MKNFGSTLVMAFIMIAVGGFAVYEYKKSEKEEGAKAQEGRLFQEAEAKFNFLKLTPTGGSSLQVSKTADGWHIDSPVQDSADETAITSFVNEIGSYKAKKLETEGPPNWEQYGLTDLARKLEVKNEGGASFELMVSHKAAFDGSYYLKFRDQLYVGDSSWGQIFQKTATELRDKRILPTPLEINGITVESGGSQRLRIRKDGDKWAFAEATGYSLDGSRLDSLLNDIRGLKAIDFVSEDQNSKAVSDAGLRKPTYRLILDLNDKNLPKVELVVSLQKDHGFLTTSNRPQIFKVSKVTAEALNKTNADMRDRRQPFQFELERVNKIRVETSLAKVEIIKDGAIWKLSQPEAGKELDMARVEEMLERIKGLEADQFLDAKVKAKGLDPAKNQVVLLGSDNKEAFRLAWGDEFKTDKTAPPLYYVRTSHTKDVMAVKTGLLMALPVQTLLKVTVPPAPSPSPSSAAP